MARRESTTADGSGAKLLRGFDLAATLVFAVEGAAVGIVARLDIFGVVVLACVTAMGGGVIRDVLVNRIPAVLRIDVYAVAALLGATVVVIGLKLSLPKAWVMLAGGAACFVLRVLAAWQHWQLPKIH
jgi:uncharacterized membrane protein YeiH